MDYGVIIISFHANVSDDQRDTIVNRCVDNQLCTTERGHLIDIRDLCKRFSSMFHTVTKGSGSVRFDFEEYKFRLVINVNE